MAVNMRQAAQGLMPADVVDVVIDQGLGTGQERNRQGSPGFEVNVPGIKIITKPPPLGIHHLFDDQAVTQNPSCSQQPALAAIILVGEPVNQSLVIFQHFQNKALAFVPGVKPGAAVTMVNKRRLMDSGDILKNVS